MAFCAQCGSETREGLCPSCGVPADGSPVAAGTSGVVLEDHIANALCYLLFPLTGVLFLVLDPYKANRSVRFHAIQSILVFAAFFLGFQALEVLAFQPVVRLFFSLIVLVYPVIFIGSWGFLTLKAYKKEQVVVPVLGAFAKSQA